MSSESGGKRFDTGKAPIHLLPFVALKEVAKVLDFGKAKYGAWNWSKGMDWSRIEASMLRHYEKYQMKANNDRDEESGLYHTAHIACNALFLLTYQLLGIGTDDRPDLGKPEYDRSKECRVSVRGGDDKVLHVSEGLPPVSNGPDMPGLCSTGASGLSTEPVAGLGGRLGSSGESEYHSEGEDIRSSTRETKEAR